MSGSLLSPEELEALREQVGPQGAPTPEEVELHSADRLLHRHLGAVEKRLAVVAEKTRDHLARLMRVALQTEAGPAEIVGPRQAKARLAELCVVLPVRHPTRGLLAVLGVDAAMSLSLVELLFGARVKAVSEKEAPVAVVAPRDLTVVEQQAVRPTLARLAELVVQSLAGPGPLSSSPDATVAAREFELPAEVGAFVWWRQQHTLGATTGTLALLLLPAMIELAFGAAAEAAPSHCTAWLKHHLRRASVEVVATLGTAQLTVAELLALRPDDVVRLDTTLADSIRIQVEGVARFVGKPTQKSGCYAVTIEAENA